MVNIGGTVKPSGGVVLHSVAAEQYPHTASITTTANICMVPGSAQTKQFKHYAFTTMLYWNYNQLL